MVVITSVDFIRLTRHAGLHVCPSIVVELNGQVGNSFDSFHRQSFPKATAINIGNKIFRMTTHRAKAAFPPSSL